MKTWLKVTLFRLNAYWVALINSCFKR